jgi:hypothetical protein
MRLRRRISTGSSPKRRAAVSISRSMVKVSIGRDTPRYGAIMQVFVATPRARTAYSRKSYGPGSSASAISGSTPQVVG